MSSILTKFIAEKKKELTELFGREVVISSANMEIYHLIIEIGGYELKGQGGWGKGKPYAFSYGPNVICNTIKFDTDELIAIIKQNKEQEVVDLYDKQQALHGEYYAFLNNLAPKDNED